MADMIKLRVTLRPDSRTPDVPPHEVDGYVPTNFSESPLAICSVHAYDFVDKVWSKATGWCIVHRPTGWRLGKTLDWRTRAEAMKILKASRPEFLGWLAAKGSKDDPATVACYSFFRLAVGGTDNAAAE